MKPAAFQYVRPETIDEALRLKAEHGDEARFLAGGQSLMPAMNFRMAQPAVLIDVNAVTGLDHVDADADAATVRIGARTRYRTLEHNAEIAAALPLVAQALPQIAHAQIRTRGTLGGNLAHADPASELPAVMLALDAWLHVRSRTGARTIAARDFFLGALTTALRDDEMLIRIEIPRQPADAGSSFLEVARRKGDFAMMGVAATLAIAPDGTCRAAAVALCSAADRPVLAEHASAALVGTRITTADIAEAARAVDAAIDPPGSLQASVAYQRHLAGVLVHRALRAAWDRATATAREEEVRLGG